MAPSPHVPPLSDYHQVELAILKDPTHPKHCLPQQQVARHAALDVGCGVGGAVHVLRLAPGALRVGIDVDLSALRAGRERFPDVHLIFASGEALPFRDGAFDFVMSRVAIPYMRLPHCVQEMRRVLSPGGNIWLSLHDWRMLRGRLLKAFRSLRARNVVYNSYVLMNGLWLHVGGATVSFPLNRRRHESFQTRRGIVTLLRRLGFGNVRTRHDTHFVVEATRPAHGP